VPGERTREVTLDPGASTDTPVRDQGPGRSLPGRMRAIPCKVTRPVVLSGFFMTLLNLTVVNIAVAT